MPPVKRTAARGRGASAAGAHPPQMSARWDPSIVRYPDPAVRVLDDRFLKYRLNAAAVERLATGFRWREGPVWFGDGRYLLFSDIPNNRILRWEEETGTVSVFRKPSDFANGNTRYRQGRLVTCEHETRRVTRTEYDGTIWIGFGGGEGVDGVAVYAPDGTMIGQILTPERVSNVCFGGRKQNRLFMTGSQSLYALYTEAQGATVG